MSITYQSPLAWPRGLKRVEHHKNAQFRVDQDKAIYEMAHEVELLGGTFTVLTSELALTRSGRPVKNQKVSDPGVAVYFQRDGKSEVIACDLYFFPEDNIRAIGKIIEAMRGIQRWGGASLLNQAFEGFKSLSGGSGPDERPWWAVLEVKPSATVLEIKFARNRLAHLYHPDSGAMKDEDRMKAVNIAYEQAIAALAALK